MLKKNHSDPERVKILKEIKNKIITISGEPVSGKSTVVREIKELYEEKGYNVHIISVGNVFREMVKKEYIKKYPDRIVVVDASKSIDEVLNDVLSIIKERIE